MNNSCGAVKSRLQKALAATPLDRAFTIIGSLDSSQPLIWVENSQGHEALSKGYRNPRLEEFKSMPLPLLLKNVIIQIHMYSYIAYLN